MFITSKKKAKLKNYVNNYNWTWTVTDKRKYSFSYCIKFIEDDKGDNHKM